MKKVLLAVLMVFASGCNYAVDLESENQEKDIVQIVVDFEDTTSVQDIRAIERELGIDLKPNSPLFGATKVMIADVPSSKLEDVEDSLRDVDSVEGASVNHLYSVALKAPGMKFFFSENTGGLTPNDPLFEKQWNFKQIGVEDAWETATGKGVVVAVLDTGLSDGNGKYGRVPDLAATCFVDGFNFVDDDEDPYDAFGHGTHVAGTIAQSTNNGIGVAGVAHGSCLMSIKVLSDRGSGYVADIAEGIRWATDNGANVINMSLGGGPHSSVMAEAVKYAHDKNVFLACAAGNGSRGVIEYPAGYDGCSAVSAVDKNANLTWYSSHGEAKNGTELFIAAPGGDTRSGAEGGILQDTVEQGNPERHGYYPFQGTSMATPHVAATAALVMETLGVDEYEVEDVEEILAESATEKDSFFKYGHGLLNASKAVKLAAEHDSDSLGFFGTLVLFLLGAGTVILRKLSK